MHVVQTYSFEISSTKMLSQNKPHEHVMSDMASL